MRRSRLIPDGVSRTTHLLYREGYTRYDFVQLLSADWALELVGWHRRRVQTLGGPGVPWFEGQHVTGLSWSSHTHLALGIEYTTDARFAPTYFNGTLSHTFSNELSLRLFAGQRRGATLCVAGVCRVAPPFTGVRLDANVKY